MLGRTLSHYEVLEKIGEGGMGEVYLAKDTNLDREVAIKVLPSAFSEDKERLARFEREARLLASLNHTNIAAIHELEESEGVHFLALEYVPGETLAERIKSGPLPIDEVLPLFRQIADGLEAAHEKGVIHRDLKPANIKVTPDGKAKVLDFGLAKALLDETPDVDSSQSPTLTKGTALGTIMGTAAYMSPEQARGKPVDKRADIWAFGCCLYETLTGEKAFKGETVTDTIAAVVKNEPDWEALQDTPYKVRDLLRRCLQKDSNRRLRDAGDAGLEIEEASVEPPGESGVRSRPSPRLRGLAFALAAFSALVGGVGVWYLRPPTAHPVTKVLVSVEPAEWLGARPPTKDGTHFGLSRTAVALLPDGKHLIYGAGDRDGFRLYLRPMDELEAKPISGTEGGVMPFVSPNGAWVGFWVDGKLKKVPTTGGPPVTLCDVGPPIGASWGSDDIILLGQYNGGILAVSAGGGELRTITPLAEGEYSHCFPQILPGGEWVLFTLKKRVRDWEEAQVVAQSIRTGERRVLIENGADARYVPTGHLVFARLGTLLAAPFHPKHLEMTGGAVGVIGDIKQAIQARNPGSDTGAAQFSFSSSGALAYVPGGIFPDIEKTLVLMDREGTAELLPAPPGPYNGPRISPNGERVVVGTISLDAGLWVYEISRGSLTRLRTEESLVLLPIWTPDGARITFASDKSGKHNLYWIPADGSGSAERLTTIEPSFPVSWSPDGQVLAFLHGPSGANYDIWMLPLDGEPRPFIETPFQERWPTFSPDGRWLAYASDQSGRYEVYVTPFPGPGPKHQISTDGGRSPAWAPNGRELFYRVLPDDEGTRSMMVVDFRAVPTFVAGRPRQLFEDNNVWGAVTRNYDVTPDGKKFLMVREENQPLEAVTHIHLVLNWFEELKHLVPTN